MKEEKLQINIQLQNEAPISRREHNLVDIIDQEESVVNEISKSEQLFNIFEQSVYVHTNEIYKIFLTDQEKAKIIGRLIVRTCNNNYPDILPPSNDCFNILQCRLIRMFKIFADEGYTAEQIEKFYIIFLDLTKNNEQFKIFGKFYKAFIQYIEAGGNENKKQVALLKNLPQELRTIFNEAMDL